MEKIDIVPAFPIFLQLSFFSFSVPDRRIMPFLYVLTFDLHPAGGNGCSSRHTNECPLFRESRPAT